jgi:RNA polymerase sigma factor (sigma-70 family)
MGAESASPQQERPGREQIEPAALDLIRRRGAEIMGTARRYAATPEDADDAYQRGLEILLTKAPSTDEDQLVPWLKTVVKHEAFALKRQRDRAVPVADGALEVMSEREAGLHERAEHLDRLGVGAEALKRLKPQEKRALLLKAQGYSYKQICEITRWTYTKVNRCLTEGRRSFLEGVTRIETGSECERLLPLISKLADHEASAEERRILGPHMTRCLACQATLRDYRRAPAAAAELAGSAALIATAAMAGGSGLGGVWDALEGWGQSAAGRVRSHFGLAGEKLHVLGETAAGHKVAAVAASTAALAGGGAVAVTSIDEPREPRPARAAPAPAQAAKPARSQPTRPRPAPSRPARAQGRRGEQRQRGPAPRPSSPAAAPAPAGPATEPAPSATPALGREPAGSSPAAPPGLPADGGEFGP